MKLSQRILLRRFSHLLLLLFFCRHSAPAQSTRAKISLPQAIEATLRQHPVLHIQEEQVRSNRGALLRAQSQFDRVIQSNASYSRTHTPLTEIERAIYNNPLVITSLTTADVSASEQFRNGVSVGPSISATRTTDNLGATGGLNMGQVTFEVNVPLLRGRGRDVVAAQETASSIEIEASLLDLNQTISDLLVNTVTAYWTTVAARHALDVYRDAEHRGQELVETVERLIAADKIPRSDLNQVLANLADRTSSRAAAEQLVLTAKQQLAVAVGTPAADLPDAPEPSDALPAAHALPDLAIRPALALALTHRADLLAARRRVNEADVLSKAARNQLKPQLDLQFSAGASGLREGARPDQFLVSPVTGVHGLDLAGGVHLQFPLENRAAAGSVISADAAARQSVWRTQDAERNITSSVIVALEGVRDASRQLAAVNESVRQFDTALDNERAKYRLGVGSLVDVLTVEDRLTGVQTTQVQAELRYAIAIARLRQATGTVVDPAKTAQQIDPAIFLRP